MAPSPLQAVALVIVGWFLGMLAPAIVERIRRDRDHPQVRRAIRGELNELRFRVTSAAYLIQVRFGVVDRQYLEWVRGVFCSYNGVENVRQTLDAINRILAEADETIEALMLKQAAGTAGGLSLKKYTAPLLETHLGTFWQLDELLQGQLLDVSAHLSLMNEEVDQARYYFKLTFDGLNEVNHLRAVENFRSSCLNIAEKARAIAEKIDKISRL